MEALSCRGRKVLVQVTEVRLYQKFGRDRQYSLAGSTSKIWLFDTAEKPLRHHSLAESTNRTLIVAESVMQVTVVSLMALPAPTS